MNRKNVASIVVILTMLAGLFGIAAPVFAAGPILSLGAISNLTHPGVSPVVGDAFDIAVNFDTNGTPIRGIQFDLTYDPAVAQITGVTKNLSAWIAPGNIFTCGATTVTTDFQVAGDYTTTPGTLAGFASAPLGVPSGSGCLGSGTIATIHFKALMNGRSVNAFPAAKVQILDGVGTGNPLPVGGYTTDVTASQYHVGPDAILVINPSVASAAGVDTHNFTASFTVTNNGTEASAGGETVTVVSDAKSGSVTQTVTLPSVAAGATSTAIAVPGTFTLSGNNTSSALNFKIAGYGSGTTTYTNPVSLVVTAVTLTDGPDAQHFNGTVTVQNQGTVASFGGELLTVAPDANSTLTTGASPIALASIAAGASVTVPASALGFTFVAGKGSSNVTASIAGYPTTMTKLYQSPVNLAVVAGSIVFTPGAGGTFTTVFKVTNVGSSNAAAGFLYNLTTDGNATPASTTALTLPAVAAGATVSVSVPTTLTLGAGFSSSVVTIAITGYGTGSATYWSSDTNGNVTLDANVPAILTVALPGGATHAINFGTLVINSNNTQVSPITVTSNASYEVDIADKGPNAGHMGAWTGTAWVAPATTLSTALNVVAGTTTVVVSGTAQQLLASATVTPDTGTTTSLSFNQFLHASDPFLRTGTYHMVLNFNAYITM